MMRNHLYLQIIDLKNLFKAYYLFRRGKRNKREVAEFELNLEQEIFSLHNQLKNFSYRHSSYLSFKVCDPKPRIIHRADVRDRIVHQALYQIICSIFNKRFIFDSYSSRYKKGHHRAVKRLVFFVKSASRNYQRSCYGIKIDIAQFFHSINHQILLELIKKQISCEMTIWLIKKIIGSYGANQGRGLPLGNLTSQLFANIYLNLLDRFIKKDLKERYYLRYCDDLMIVREKAGSFPQTIARIKFFLQKNLSLTVKNDRLMIRKLKWGFDYLGYVVLPFHVVLRTRTRQRMMLKIKEKEELLQSKMISQESFGQTINSYLGMLSHSNSYKITKTIKKYCYV